MDRDPRDPLLPDGLYGLEVSVSSICSAYVLVTDPTTYGGDLCLRNSAGKSTTSQYLILFNILPLELESRMRKLRDKFEKAAMLC